MHRVASSVPGWLDLCTWIILIDFSTSALTISLSFSPHSLSPSSLCRTMSHFRTARAGPRIICTVIIHFVATAVKLAHYKFLHYGEVRLCPEGTIMCRTCPSKAKRVEEGHGEGEGEKNQSRKARKKRYTYIYISVALRRLGVDSWQSLSALAGPQSTEHRAHLESFPRLRWLPLPFRKFPPRATANKLPHLQHNFARWWNVISLCQLPTRNSLRQANESQGKENVKVVERVATSRAK